MDNKEGGILVSCKLLSPTWMKNRSTVGSIYTAVQPILRYGDAQWSLHYFSLRHTFHVVQGEYSGKKDSQSKSFYFLVF